MIVTLILAPGKLGVKLTPIIRNLRKLSVQLGTEGCSRGPIAETFNLL